MVSNLCDLCRQFDVRKLLLESAQQTPAARRTQLTGLMEEDLIWQQGLPAFFRHHSTLSNVKISAGHGCEFCSLIWSSWTKSETSDPSLDDRIDKSGKGQIFIGTSSFNVSKGQSPVITVSQRPVNMAPRTLCNFEAFSGKGTLEIEECKWVGRSVASHSASAECAATAKSWLDDCINTHENCGLRKALRPPTRLINVGTSESGPHPFLDIQSKPTGCTWAALSYCWGGESSFVLRRDTIKDLTRGVPLQRFPATLRDAVMVTRCLGIKYIWIDALCIIQDSSDDWNIEASRMRDVYSGAAVTIVAAATAKTSTGIFSERAKDIWGVTCELPWGASPSQSVCIRSSSNTLSNSAYSNPLQARGWTLQEGLLSPRTLSYCVDQMVWECSNFRADEGGHTAILEHKYDSKDLFYNRIRIDRLKAIHYATVIRRQYYLKEIRNQAARIGWYGTYLRSSMEPMEEFLGVNPYIRWNHIVLEFSSRKLTKVTDTFPAIGGIARAFASVTKDTYCAGMWKSEILEHLLWWREASMTTDDMREYHPDNFDLSRPETYLAPTWSWAGLPGRKVWMSSNNISGAVPIQSLASIVQISLKAANGDPYAKIESGFLRVKASLFPLEDLWEGYFKTTKTPWNSQPPAPGISANPTSLHSFIQHQINTSSHAAFEFEQQHIAHSSQKFVALLLAYMEGLDEDRKLVKNDPEHTIVGKAHFLILESTGRRPNEYRRIGVADISRPTYPMTIIDPSTHGKMARNLDEFSGLSWERYQKTFHETNPEWIREYGAWMEIAKRRPKRKTITIV